MFTQNQKAFALAMIAFAMPAAADQSDACTATYTGEIRNSTQTWNSFDDNWVDGFYQSDLVRDVNDNLEKRYCSNDGSIRNAKNQCLTWMQYATDETVGTSECSAAYKDCETGNVNQAFTIEATKTCEDYMGNANDCVAFKNTGKGSCLDDTAGICSDDCTQMPMFRQKGTVITSGNLASFKSERCLIPVENDDEAQVTTIECDDDDVNQQFTLYSNGELRHDATGQCLGNNETTTGIFSISYCEDILEQGFKALAQDDGTYVLNWMANTDMCATEVSAQEGSVAPRACNSNNEQKWNFGSHTWTSPKFTWVEMGCGNGIDTAYAYSEQFTVTNNVGVVSDANDEIVDQAKESLMNNDSLTNGVSVRQSDARSLSEDYSMMMYHPSDASVDRSHLVTCSGESTCMYRSVMTMQNSSLATTLTWVTGYTRCMEAMPVCVPLTKFENNECIAESEYAYTE